MKYTDCPMCGEPEPLDWPGESGEPDMQECPECGWAEEYESTDRQVEL